MHTRTHTVILIYTVIIILILLCAFEGLHDKVQTVVHDNPFRLPDSQTFKPADIQYDEDDDFIGSGGFAEVFKAVVKHEGQKMVVALKKPDSGRHFTDKYVQHVRF